MWAPGVRIRFLKQFLLVTALLGSTRAALAHVDTTLNEVRFGINMVDYFSGASGLREPVYPSLDLAAQGLSRGPVLEAGGQAFVKYTLLPSGPFLAFEAPEAFVGISAEPSPIFRLHFGRRLEAWSTLDDQWQMGIWQNRFRFDPLNPQSVGLMGLFMSIDLPVFRFVAFASPFFVPERGGPIDFRDGQVYSQMPFFAPPTSSFPVFGKDTPAQYSLNVPGLDTILLNGSASLQARVGEERGVWGSFSFAYKPMNQLIMAYDYTLLVGPTRPTISLTLYPRLTYHYLAGAEGGYKGDRIDFSVAVLGEVPVPAETPAQWATQVVKPAAALSPSLTFRFGHRPRPGKSPELTVSYLYQWGGNAPDSNSPVPGSASNFEPRYLFQNALLTTIQSPIAWGLSARTRWTVDIGHDGLIAQNELTYRPQWRVTETVRQPASPPFGATKPPETRLKQSAFSVGLGLDLMVAGLTRPTPYSASDFISLYQENSRVRLGVSYAF